MAEIIIYFDCILFCVDCVVISALRRFLFDFLINSKNRKSAEKIHAQQTLRSRITYSYAWNYLKQYKNKFKRYRNLYLFILLSLPSQYIIVIISNIICEEKSLNVIVVFALVKIIIALIVRLQTDSNLLSRYRK